MIYMPFLLQVHDLACVTYTIDDLLVHLLQFSPHLLFGSLLHSPSILAVTYFLIYSLYCIYEKRKKNRPQKVTCISLLKKRKCMGSAYHKYVVRTFFYKVMFVFFFVWHMIIILLS
ncbi:hypothetical protein BDF21DRAFT_416528 [Thamnidium elegans]|nr:hypothetical protein BDF21DRAFT_416528 [Thamnidium elegans]